MNKNVTGRATLSLPLSRTLEQGWKSCSKFLYTAITHKEQILRTRPGPLGTPMRDPLRNFPRPQGVVPSLSPC